MAQQQSTKQPIDYRRTFINSCPIKHTVWMPDDISLNPFTGTDFEPLPEDWKPWRAVEVKPVACLIVERAKKAGRL